MLFTDLKPGDIFTAKVSTPIVTQHYVDDEGKWIKLIYQPSIISGRLSLASIPGQLGLHPYVYFYSFENITPTRPDIFTIVNAFMFVDTDQCQKVLDSITDIKVTEHDPVSYPTIKFKGLSLRDGNWYEHELRQLGQTNVSFEVVKYGLPHQIDRSTLHMMNSRGEWIQI